MFVGQTGLPSQLVIHSLGFPNPGASLVRSITYAQANYAIRTFLIAKKTFICFVCKENFSLFRVQTESVHLQTMNWPVLISGEHKKSDPLTHLMKGSSRLLRKERKEHLIKVWSGEFSVQILIRKGELPVGQFHCLSWTLLLDLCTSKLFSLKNMTSTLTLKVFLRMAYCSFVNL